MEGTVIKRLRERSFSRSFRHPSPRLAPYIFKSLLMARTHARFARSPSPPETLANAPRPRVKVPDGENGNGPDANNEKFFPFSSRFRLSTLLLLTLPSSLYGEGASRFISQVFGKGDQNSGQAGSLPTPHLCRSFSTCPKSAKFSIFFPFNELFIYRAISRRRGNTFLFLSFSKFKILLRETGYKFVFSFSSVERFL